DAGVVDPRRVDVAADHRLDLVGAAVGVVVPERVEVRKPIMAHGGVLPSEAVARGYRNGAAVSPAATMARTGQVGPCAHAARMSYRVPPSRYLHRVKDPRTAALGDRSTASRVTRLPHSQRFRRRAMRSRCARPASETAVKARPSESRGRPAR